MMTSAFLFPAFFCISALSECLIGVLLSWSTPCYAMEGLEADQSWLPIIIRAGSWKVYFWIFMATPVAASASALPL